MTPHEAVRSILGPMTSEEKCRRVVEAVLKASRSQPSGVLASQDTTGLDAEASAAEFASHEDFEFGLCETHAHKAVAAIERYISESGLMDLSQSCPWADKVEELLIGVSTTLQGMAWDEVDGRADIVEVAKAARAKFEAENADFVDPF